LSERQWGTVREDYSPQGTAWDSFPHDHARSRAYRGGEDGIAGISDRHQEICFAVALWNGRDPILKERLFGLTGNEGNHGEDVKEYYFYLDSTPTHSYMKYLYKYRQAEFPYVRLVEENRSRDRSREWRHLYNADILSLPDKWEYPWYAAWDLAFHSIPLAMVDPDFAKEQLILLLREWYMHPNGQLPAYEWAFGDVNPPVASGAERSPAGLLRHGEIPNRPALARPDLLLRVLSRRPRARLGVSHHTGWPGLVSKLIEQSAECNCGFWVGERCATRRNSVGK
jgi:hypothetical protein